MAKVISGRSTSSGGVVGNLQYGSNILKEQLTRLPVPGLPMMIERADQGFKSVIRVPQAVFWTSYRLPVRYTPVCLAPIFPDMFVVIEVQLAVDDGPAFGV